MKYFSFTLLLTLSLSANALDFRIIPKDDLHNELIVIGDKIKKTVEIDLEGNANQSYIRDELTFSCEWGVVEVVRVSMESSTVDGTDHYNNIYAFRKDNMKEIHRESYYSENNSFKLPPNIREKICSSEMDYPSINVTECQRDYSNIDFCDSSHTKAMKDAVTQSKPNFNKIYLVINFKENDDRFSYAAINTINGKVYPLPFDYFGGHVDDYGNPRKNLKSAVEFKTIESEICFIGSIYEYKNIRTNTKTCYELRSDGFYFVDELN